MTVLCLKPVVLAFACIAVMPCISAPSVPTDPNQASDAAELTSLGGAAGRGAEGSGSRSVDLLLQMQQRSAGISFNERVRGRDGGDSHMRPVATSTAAAETSKPQANQAPSVPTAPSGLFGSGATPMVTTQRNISVSPGFTIPSGTAQAGSVRGASVSSNGGGEPPNWLLWPRDLIEYVRENRATVIGGIAALCALSWVGTLLIARSRA